MHKFCYLQGLEALCYTELADYLSYMGSLSISGGRTDGQTDNGNKPLSTFGAIKVLKRAHERSAACR